MRMPLPVLLAMLSAAVVFRIRTPIADDTEWRSSPVEVHSPCEANEAKSAEMSTGRGQVAVAHEKARVRQKAFIVHRPSETRGAGLPLGIERQAPDGETLASLERIGLSGLSHAELS